jgi:hypothetical protein
MNSEAHLEALKTKHAKIDEQIEKLMPHASVNDSEIHDLKRQKLKIKDEIENLAQQLQQSKH